MDARKLITKSITQALKELNPDQVFNVELVNPTDHTHGDLTTNIALKAFGIFKNTKDGFNRSYDQPVRAASPMEMAEKIKNFVKQDENVSEIIDRDRIEVANPGFINFWLSRKFLSARLHQLLTEPEKETRTTAMQGKKFMVEFAHPNTHKELHIGHMRTLTTGESLSRIFTANGATVFRANYQGDIGPHVAKAIYGIIKLMEEKGLSIEAVEEWSSTEKAHFLGEGYARGSNDYQVHKEEIDTLNTKLYVHDNSVEEMYHRTRKWSLDYYDEFYTRFYTKFDHLFFESQMVDTSKRIVKEHVGDVFQQDADGSIIFPGEKYGLHTRVFVTQKDNPTYEGKEIALGFAEYEAFPFDQKVHVVASEQIGYFQVVFKALEMIDPEKFVGHQYHLPMGMVQLTDRKMSSRTGDVLTVDWLIDQVKAAAEKQFAEGKLVGEERAEVLEQVAIGAVKYSVLKGGTKQDVAFDIEKSVALDGDSGVYLQYTAARTNSVLAKAEGQRESVSSYANWNEEEELLVRSLFKFPSILAFAGEHMAPNAIASYLFDLAKLYNLFYQKNRILDAGSTKEREFRLGLTRSVGIILVFGLALLGIEAPKRM
ncbi:MAG: arginine--tRNA ligase [Patescibacteria group bacterium]|nr:arginine--tRNA ligase [Patescibacteria group bacterium]MDE2588100.1 arginine--tRNA ligase [Patescibacteria group bacterium]